MESSFHLSAAFWLVLLVIAFASAVKSAVGFGFPLIAVPLAANLIGARTAIVLIAIPVVFNNVLVLFRGGGSAARFRHLAGMLLGVVVGTAIGAQFLRRLDPGVLSIVVGALALVFATTAIAGRMPSISPRAQAYAGPGIGLASGIMGGTTGIFAPLLAVYAHSLQLEKREFVSWLTVSFLLGGLVQAVSYYQLGLYTGPLALAALLACLPVMVGTRVGFWIQDRLPPELFSRLVLLLVLASGLNLIVRELL